MLLLSALIVTAGVGVGQQEPSDLAAAAVAPLAANTLAEPAVPELQFEIRELAMASPDWRGALQSKLKTIAREGGVSTWAVDGEGLRRLLTLTQADEEASVVVAPKLSARLGEPVRMTNEQTIHYVAQLDLITDGPPDAPTGAAFKPEIAELQDGVRVVLTDTRFQESALFAHVVVQSSSVQGMVTTFREETFTPSESDPGVVRASFLPKLKADGRKSATIRGAIQVPEVSFSRIEGDWLIPSDGALVVSLGPDSNARIDRKAYGEKVGGLGRALAGRSEKRGYEERVICITAYTKPEHAQSAPSKVDLHP